MFNFSKYFPTRLRPDQRALEEGRVAEAENIKLGVEQSQRDRRRQTENMQVVMSMEMFVLLLLMLMMMMMRTSNLVWNRVRWTE